MATPTSPARLQRLAILLAARAIRQGRTPQNPKWISRVLINAAKTISLEQGGHASRRKFDHPTFLLRYGWLRHHEGMSHDQAKKRLLDDFDISPQAVTDTLTDEAVAYALAQFKGVPKRPSKKKKR